jgi:spermidine/putrescine transport system substrate-binding protein
LQKHLLSVQHSGSILAYRNPLSQQSPGTDVTAELSDADTDAGRTIRRRSFLRAAGVGTMAAVAGCSGGPGAGGSDSGGADGELADELTVHGLGGTWGENVRAGYVETFEEEFGVDVTYREHGGAGELITEIQAGRVDTHVVEQNDPTVYQGIVNDVWQPLREENLPNLDNVVAFDPQDSPVDPGEEIHHVPNLFGGYGLVYNEEVIDEPTSWQDIYVDGLENAVTHSQFTESVVALAATELGLDFNDLGEDEIDQVFDRVAEQNEFVVEWWDSGATAEQLFATGEANAGSFWLGRTQSLRENDGVPLRYTVPEEGTLAWIDCWTIPAGIEEPHRRTAEAFLNHVLAVEPSEEIARRISYAQAIELENPPEGYSQNPDVVNSDRLRVWNHELLNENRKTWSQRFQKAIR